MMLLELWRGRSGEIGVFWREIERIGKIKLEKSFCTQGEFFFFNETHGLGPGPTLR
jgi:hypothetical protein